MRGAQIALHRGRLAGGKAGHRHRHHVALVHLLRADGKLPFQVHLKAEPVGVFAIGLARFRLHLHRQRAGVAAVAGQLHLLVAGLVALIHRLAVRAGEGQRDDALLGQVVRQHQLRVRGLDHLQLLLVQVL